MSRSLRSLVLLAAFLVPTALLAWIGLRTVREQSERGAERYREQALALIDAINARIERDLADLGTAGSQLSALEVRFAKDGLWLGDSFERAPLADTNARDPVLFATLRSDVDRAQAKGDISAAIARLGEATTKDDDPPIAAWALETRAALRRLSNDVDGARADLEALIERYPNVRDSHELRRSFAARMDLARANANGVDERLRLYGDLIDDHRALEQTATAQMLADVRAALLAGPLDGNRSAQFDELDRRATERERRLRWLASIPTGISNWIAQGAPGGVAVFDLARSPIETRAPSESDQDAGGPLFDRVLVRVRSERGELRGSAIELFRLLLPERGEHALPMFGFSPSIDDPNGRSFGLEPARAQLSARVEPVAAREAPFAQRALAHPLEDFSIAIRGGDLAGFVASERIKFLWIAAVVAAALAVAIFAAFATLRAIAREVEAAKGREAFVAAVTHELKAPLAAIRLFAEVLERGDVEPNKVREFGTRTVQESDRLARLIDSVLDLAKIEHSKNGALAQSIELAEVARRVVATFDSVARERGFSVELHAADGVRVRGDRDALEGALFNLLDNALKYSDSPHAIQVEVARAANGAAELAVLDRGRGVALEDRERIFEPFTRVGDELTRDRPGVGLGLALVAKIAAVHGGRARLEAREGGGSRFSIELPSIT